MTDNTVNLNREFQINQYESEKIKFKIMKMDLKAYETKIEE